MRVAAAWRLCLTCLTSRTCLTSWCAPVYPGGLLAAVWYGSGEDLPLGYARQLDGNGGMRVAWVWLGGQIYRKGNARQLDGNGGMRVAAAWRLCQTCLTCLTCLTRWGRLGIPRGFACRSLVWLGRRCAAGVIQRADLPQGNALLA